MCRRAKESTRSFSARRGTLLASRFSVFFGRFRLGDGHAESYGVLLPVQAKRFEEEARESKSKGSRFVNRRFLMRYGFARRLEADRLSRPGIG